MTLLKKRSRRDAKAQSYQRKIRANLCKPVLSRAEGFVAFSGSLSLFYENWRLETGDWLISSLQSH